MAGGVNRYSAHLTPRQREGRAANAIAELLAKTLSVPNIYLEPHSERAGTDVLAVDRAGSGDLHGVQIKLFDQIEGFRSKNPLTTADLNRLNDNWLKAFAKDVSTVQKRLISLPVHYKYLAVPETALDLVMGEIGPRLYSPDGIGRIGIIAVTDAGDLPPKARLVIAPERFRVDGAALSKIERDLIANPKIRPDMEVLI
jgi:hypothetical protein